MDDYTQCVHGHLPHSSVAGGGLKPPDSSRTHTLATLVAYMKCHITGAAQSLHHSK